MLYLLLKLGNDRYAIEAGRVCEVVPVTEFKGIPHAGTGVTGLFNWHGKLLPLIDLTELMLGRASHIKMSTRIIVVSLEQAAAEGGSKNRRIGLLAEQVTETIRKSESEFAASGISNNSTPYLGAVAKNEQEIIQRIEIEKIIAERLSAELFMEHMCPA